MKQKAIFTVAFFGLAAIFLSLTGCPGDNSTGQITLVISPTSIPADGDTSAEITATITDFEGNPAYIGTAVTFKTNRGLFRRGSKTITVETTSRDGIVKVYLIAKLGTNPGTALITATANDASASGNVEITVYGPPGRTAKIDLTANPESILPDGKSEITAVLTDGNGDSVFIGTSMTFTDITDLGTFFQNGRNSITVVTRDTTGTESVNYIAGSTSGTARIECRSNGVIDLVYVTIGNTDPTHITLSASPDSIPADGETLSLITATVTFGGQPIVGTEVKFEVVTGLFTNGRTTFYDATDTSGVSVANFYAPVGTTPGVVQIKVTAGGVSARIPVTVAGPCTTTPASITLVASPATIPANGTTLSTLTATILDAAGDNVCPGVPATFSKVDGAPAVTTLTVTSTTTNANGQAISQLFGTTGGGVTTVTCTAGGVTGSTAVSITP